MRTIHPAPRCFGGLGFGGSSVVGDSVGCSVGGATVGFSVGFSVGGGKVGFAVVGETPQSVSSLLSAHCWTPLHRKPSNRHVSSEQMNAFVVLLIPVHCSDQIRKLNSVHH